MKLRRVNASVFRIGPGADRFVQAYTTQTPTATRGAFIDPKGRAVAVFDRVRLDADRSVFAVAGSVLERLQKHLKPFLTLMDSELVMLPHVVRWDIAPAGSGSSADPGDWRIDRRNVQVIVSERPAPDTVSAEEFALFRVLNGLPLQGVDYDDPMLLNLNEPELVSFGKGCYLGQEIMARVHYKGRPPLKLTPVLESECPEEFRPRITSRVWDPVAGAYRGFVFLPA